MGLQPLSLLRSLQEAQRDEITPFISNKREALKRKEKAEKKYAFIPKDAGACLRTETTDIRMAYGAAYPKVQLHLTLKSAHDSWNHSFTCRSLGFVLLLLFRGFKTGFQIFLFEKEEVTGQAKEMPKEQMLLFETKALAETYLPLNNTIDKGVREALKKSDRSRKKERMKTLWVARKRREDT
ncbi:hypothetical protein H5410_028063 [Solanum commersonii]|uniref:Uncharacterized protein n=1 Tax=Solanum commersonii TaxID=4109 RepID=A0A9J5Z0W4_SOLCO|nr:hypothetical protein H5410_028063 [Solanum commersonii]